LKKSNVLLFAAAALAVTTLAFAAGKDAPIYTPPTPVAPVPAPASQPAVDPSKVIASVGDEKITAGEFADLLSTLQPQMQAQLAAHPEGKRQLVDELINLKILSDEARRRRLDQVPATRLRDQQVLAEALSQSLSDDSAGDEKFFNDNKDYFSEVNARHILIATADSAVHPAKKLSDAEALAKATSIKARIAKGEDFAAIAKAESDDTSSGAQGGDLGSVSRGKMVPPFEAAVFSLKKNEVSDPVRTQFGYHIIQVTSDKTAPAFADAKTHVEQRRFEMMLEDLKKQAKPEYDEEFFGGKPATQPATAPATQQ
jgi:peptidyl-prolyl cis-trans isomerase C